MKQCFPTLDRQAVNGAENKQGERCDASEFQAAAQKERQAELGRVFKQEEMELRVCRDQGPSF